MSAVLDAITIGSTGTPAAKFIRSNGLLRSMPKEEWQDLDELFGGWGGKAILGAAWLVVVLAASLTFVAGIVQEQVDLMATGGLLSGQLVLAFLAYYTLKVNRSLARSNRLLTKIQQESYQRSEARFTILRAEMTPVSLGKGALELEIVNSGWKDSALERASIRYDWDGPGSQTYPLRISRHRYDRSDPTPAHDLMVRSGERIVFDAAWIEKQPHILVPVRTVLRVKPVLGAATEHVIDGAPLPLEGEGDTWRPSAGIYSLVRQQDR